METIKFFQRSGWCLWVDSKYVGVFATRALAKKEAARLNPSWTERAADSIADEVLEKVSLAPIYIPPKIWHVEKNNVLGDYIIERYDEHDMHWHLRTEDGCRLQRFPEEAGATMVAMHENAKIIKRVDEWVKWLGYDSMSGDKKGKMYREMAHFLLECDTPKYDFSAEGVAEVIGVFNKCHLTMEELLNKWNQCRGSLEGGDNVQVE